VWEIDWVFPANTYTVSCEECGLKVLSGAGLSRHEKVHGPGKPTSRGLEVVCTECIPHLVLQFGSLGSHAKSVHEKDQFHLKWYFSGISVSELHFCKHPLRGGGECTMKYPTFGGLIMHQRNAQHKNKDNELLWAKLRMEGKAEEPEVIPA
jgi:ribosomal protein S27E